MHYDTYKQLKTYLILITHQQTKTYITQVVTNVKQPPMEGPHRPNSEEDQLYAWVSPKEPMDQQHRHKMLLKLQPTRASTSSAHIRILCLCMEHTHRATLKQTGNGAKEDCQVLYKQLSQYQQCDRNVRRSSTGNIKSLDKRRYNSPCSSRS